MKHTWQLDERGEPDEFAHDVEAETTGHNGPRCTVCGFFFCVHCADGWGHECPGPPPEGFEFDWIGDGTGQPPAEPDLWPRRKLSGDDQAVTDLITFLRGRLDEDERIARAATPGPWSTPDPYTIAEWSIYGDGWMIASTRHYPKSDMVNDFPKLRKPATVVEHGNENAAHIARRDPARVLAEVDAKRRILAEHAVVDPDDEWAHCRVCHDYERHDAADAPCRTLRLLALPFAGHPDYDESWAP